MQTFHKIKYSNYFYSSGKNYAILGQLRNGGPVQKTSCSLFLIMTSIYAFKELSFDVWVAETNYELITHNRPSIGQGQK